MDLSKMNRSQWMVAGGTLGALLGTLIFPWYSISAGPFSVDVSAWDSGILGKLALIGMLLMVAGVVVTVMGRESDIPVPLPMAMLCLGVFVAVMPILKWIDVSSYTAFGLYLTIVSGAVAAYGAFEMGGRLRMPTSVGGS
jgi:hypothetical protein